MYFDDEEEALLEEADYKAKRNNNKIYLVTFNLRNHNTKAKLLEYPEDIRKLKAMRILFTPFVGN